MSVSKMSTSHGDAAPKTPTRQEALDLVLQYNETASLINHAKAVKLAGRRSALDGVEVLVDSFFNEFTIRLPKPAADVAEALAGKGILCGVPASRLYPESAEMEPLLLVAATETNTEADIDAVAEGLTEAIR